MKRPAPEAALRAAGTAVQRWIDQGDAEAQAALVAALTAFAAVATTTPLPGRPPEARRQNIAR
jgi:hypothetical protein